MATFKCVTSMNTSYYNRIGHRMVESFVNNWPSDIELLIYHEDDLNIPQYDNVKLINLKDCEPTLFDFVNRHKDRPDQQNKDELFKGAVRFSYKTFSILNAGKTVDTDYLVWIDADTYTHTRIHQVFLEAIVDPTKYLTYLGRDNNYSECGFVIYNLKHPAHKAFFDTWRHLYETDEVFKLEQWHDSFVFDCIRKTYEKNNVIANINLSPWGKDYDHVFINSVLGDYMDHMKGPRKDEGSSRKRDLKMPKSGVYWSNL